MYLEVLTLEEVDMILILTSHLWGNRHPYIIHKSEKFHLASFLIPIPPAIVSSCKLYDMLRYGYPLRSCLWVSVSW